MRAPKKLHGKGRGSRWLKPDCEWLEYQRVTCDKTTLQIASEVGTSSTTVLKWFEAEGLYTVYRVPETPSKEELERAYSGQGMKDAGKEFGVGVTTFAMWLRIRGIPAKREGQPRTDHPAEGTLIWRARQLMKASGIPKKCTWCGTKDSGRWRKGKQLSLSGHHKDHDLSNEDLENLQYLCLACHKLESWAWTAWKAGKIQLTGRDRSMILEFPKRTKDIKAPIVRGSNWKPRESRRGWEARDVLGDSGRPRVCEWCNYRATFLDKSLCTHHWNHDPFDNREVNLSYLCWTCNILEGWIWNAWDRGKVLVEEIGDGSGLIISSPL